MLSSSCSDGYSGENCGTPRLDYQNINLKNITVRSRNKKCGTSSKLSEQYYENSPDSDGTCFEEPNQKEIDRPNPFEAAHLSKPFRDSFLKELKVDSYGNKTARKCNNGSVNKIYIHEDDVPGKVDYSVQNSSNIFSKHSSISERKCRVETECKDDSEYVLNNMIENCSSCKNQFKTVTVDVHCENDVNRSRVSSLDKDVRSRASDVYDVESSSYFHPPYSSTRLCRGVKSTSLNKQNLQMSGIEELNSLLLNESIDKIDSNPVGLQRNVPAYDEILRAPSGSSQGNSTDDNNDDDIPLTQPATTVLLHDVVAFVDVKIGNLAISDNLKQQLTSLGAEVEEKFCRRVTHVIFKDGNVSTYKKAKRWKVPLVNIMWINDCATSLSVLPIDNYLPSGLDKYEVKVVNNLEKDIFDISKKYKAFSANKIKKMRNNVKKLEEDVLAITTPEHNQTCKFNIIEEFIKNLDGEVRDMINRSESPESSEDIHIPVPLSLLRKCITPRKAKTDTKVLPTKTGNMNCRLSERRKNLDNLLVSNKNNLVNGDDLNKENVDSSEEYHTERKSAPSELGKSYKHNLRKRKCMEDEDKIKIGNQFDDVTNNHNLLDKDNCVNTHQLTQTSKKRQLLPLEQPVNDLITDTLNNSHDQIQVRNPYESPKQKCRKILKKQPSTVKKQFKGRLRPVLQRIDEVPRERSSSQSTVSSDLSRRSSSVFFVNKKNTMKMKAVVHTIVCTGVSVKTCETVHSIVEQLGTYQMEKKVSERTTHIIVEKENFRTVNLLKGIARGCWIVSVEWVYSSLESNKWICEEQFEVTSFSPAVRLNRYDRQSFGQAYSFELLDKCGPIFVNNKCDPPAQDIKELIRLCSGRVIDNHRAASLIIGKKPSMISKTPHVSEKWVLDCITKLKVLPYDEYLLPSLRLS